MWSGNPEINHVALIEKVRVLEEELRIVKTCIKKQQTYIDLLVKKVFLSNDSELPIAKKVEM